MGFNFDNSAGTLSFVGSTLIVKEDSGFTIKNSAGTNSVNLSATNTSELTVGGSLVASSIKNSALTSGRVTFGGTSGLLQDSANLTFDGTFLIANSIKDSALTSGQVLFAGASGLLTDSSNLTWDNSTGLSLGRNLNLNNNQATSFRIENVSSNPVAGNAGRLVWNTTAAALEIDNGASFTSLSPVNYFTGAITSSSSAVTNTTTATNFNQAISIGANTIAAGDVIKIYACGTLNWNVSTTLAFVIPNYTYGLVISFSLGTAFSNGYWIIEGDMICITTGVSGSFNVSLKGTVQTTSSGVFTTQIRNFNTSINTTLALSTGVGVQWQSASSSDTITMTQLDVLHF